MNNRSESRSNHYHVHKRRKRNKNSEINKEKQRQQQQQQQTGTTKCAKNRFSLIFTKSFLYKMAPHDSTITQTDINATHFKRIPIDN